MDQDDKLLIDALKTTHPELHRLCTKHEEYEQQLDALQAGRWRSPQEEAESRRLKRLKLAGRDRMASILAEHRATQA